MCGRYTQMLSWNELVRLATLTTPDLPSIPLVHSFNVAPTQEVVIVRQGTSGPEPAIVRWGLVPHWAGDSSVGSKMINARAETIATKHAFRQAFRDRRCLIPANGFYESRKAAKRSGKKQPLYVRLKSEEPFAFAGLWERWEKGDKPLETCTIITCQANELISEFHDRMPVILTADQCQKWLIASDVEELQSLLVPYPASQMTAYPVSAQVNGAGRNHIESILPPAESVAKENDVERTGTPTQRALGFADC